MQEIFKDINGFDGRYKASKRGNIYSLKHNLILKPSIDINGYCYVSLYKRKVHKKHKVHRLVISTFKSNTDNKPCINHIDGIKTNNHVNNLEWVTHKENTKHMMENGLWNKPTLHKGKYNVRSKTVIRIDEDGNKKHYDSIKLASIDNKVHYSSISNTCRGIYKTSAGFKWEYKCQ